MESLPGSVRCRFNHFESSLKLTQIPGVKAENCWFCDGAFTAGLSCLLTIPLEDLAD